MEKNNNGFQTVILLWIIGGIAGAFIVGGWICYTLGGLGIISLIASFTNRNPYPWWAEAAFKYLLILPAFMLVWVIIF